MTKTATITVKQVNIQPKKTETAFNHNGNLCGMIAAGRQTAVKSTCSYSFLRFGRLAVPKP